MGTIMKRATLSMTLFIIGLTSLSGQDLKSISRQYFDAYFSMDQAEYSKYMAEDVTWSDPTWSEIDPSNKPVSGKSAVLAHLKTATEGLSNLSYAIEEHFVSGPVAVFEGIMKYTFNDAGSGKSFDFEIREVSVLEFRDGKIIKHTDYSDFKTWLQQYQSQQ